MNYFDYLWWYKLEDTKDNFITYLIEELNWCKKDAVEYTKTFY